MTVSIFFIKVSRINVIRRTVIKKYINLTNIKKLWVIFNQLFHYVCLKYSSNFSCSFLSFSCSHYCCSFGEILKSLIFTNICLKFRRNFRQYFASFLLLSYFPKNICWEITYTMPSDMFIFDNILKLQFLLILWIFWQNFGNIQSLGTKFSRNFPLNIDEIFGAATLDS